MQAKVHAASAMQIRYRAGVDDIVLHK